MGSDPCLAGAHSSWSFLPTGVGGAGAALGPACVRPGSLGVCPAVSGVGRHGWARCRRPSGLSRSRPAARPGPRVLGRCPSPWRQPPAGGRSSLPLPGLPAVSAAPHLPWRRLPGAWPRRAVYRASPQWMVLGRVARGAEQSCACGWGVAAWRAWAAATPFREQSTVSTRKKLRSGSVLPEWERRGTVLRGVPHGLPLPA